MTLPRSMAFLFKVIRDSLGGDGRYIEMPLETVSLGEAFRADAKAEGQTVVVGGWECLGGGRPGGARWFSVILDRKSAPWAFAKGEPFKVVAALELYATLLCVMAFGDTWSKAATGRITITGATDNQGNSQVLG